MSGALSRKLMGKLNRLCAAVQGSWNAKIGLRNRIMLAGRQTVKRVATS